MNGSIELFSVMAVENPVLLLGLKKALQYRSTAVTCKIQLPD